MADELATKVMSCIAETQRLEPGKVTIDKTFEELEIDSLDGINILFALETEFGIDIPDDEAQQVRTVEQMVEGVRKLVKAKGPSDPGSASAS